MRRKNENCFHDDLTSLRITQTGLNFVPNFFSSRVGKVRLVGRYRLPLTSCVLNSIPSEHSGLGCVSIR